MKKMKRMKKNSGQALLIITLVVAVVLTIGLAAVSRSITNIRVARQEEESARIFSVAEAGVEQALKLGSATTGSVGNISYNVTQVGQGGGTEYVFPKAIDAGDIQTIWLVGHDANGNLDPTVSYSGTKIQFYWGNSGTPADQSTTPALEATLFYKQGTDYKIVRYALDPNSSRRNSNSFAAISGGTGYSVAGQTLQFYTEVNLPSGVTFYALRLKLVYNTSAQLLGVKAVGGTLPSQGMCYASTATNPNTNITRKVQQCQFYKAPSPMFDYLLFSSGDLSK